MLVYINTGPEFGALDVWLIKGKEKLNSTEIEDIVRRVLKESFSNLMDAGISEARVELLIENALAKSKGDLEKMESSLKILKDKIAVFETNHGKEYKLVQEKILDLQKSVSDKTSSRSDELDQVSKIIGTLKQRLDQTEKALENAITQETFDNLIKERYSKLVINNPFMHIYVC